MIKTQVSEMIQKLDAKALSELLKEVKLYNEIGSGVTASKLIFHGKFGTAANHVHEFKIPGAGIYADTGIYADLTNVDFFYIVGTF